MLRHLSILVAFLAVATYTDVWNELRHMGYDLRPMYCNEDDAGNPQRCYMPLDDGWNEWAYIWTDEANSINIRHVYADCGEKGCG
jgi:hypothetical protein